MRWLFSLSTAILFWSIILAIFIITNRLLLYHASYDLKEQVKISKNYDKKTEKINDFAAGRIVFNQCAVCHKNSADLKSQIGPNLYLVVGRKIATMKNFAYSPQMLNFAQKNKIWTEDLLDKFLQNPQAEVRGTRMSFGGISDKKKRSQLILYLEKEKPKAHIQN